MTAQTIENRQTIRSKRMLRDALISLLHEKSYHKISITEIARQADLARATFYAHFETKDDLLYYFVDDVLDQFFVQTKSLVSQRDEPDFEQRLGTKFFQLWVENHEVLEVIHKIDVDSLLINRFKLLFQRLLDAKMIDQPDLNTSLVSYVMNHNAYALVGIFRQWVDEGMIHSPEVMGLFIANHIGPRRLAETVEAFHNLIVPPQST